MKFKEILKKSEIILIEGEKKTGKLTFSLNECAQEERDKILLFSTYAKPIIFKRIEAIKNQNIEAINNILPNLEVLALKEEWPKIKALYGIDFLIKDIYRAIEHHKPQSVIFHRFDMFFESFESGNLKIFLEEISNLRNSTTKFKIFFTANPSENNNSTISTIEDFSDLNLEMEKIDSKRIIQVKHSIFPTSIDKCEIKIEDSELILIPYVENYETSKPFVENKEDKQIDVLLISQNESLIKMFSYIFNKKPFFFDIAKNTSEIINKILLNPDIIIYNPFDESIDFSVCNTIKQNKLKSKIIYITNEEYIRGDDKITAINEGCYDVFPINFNLLDFLSEIEKLIGISFYTTELNKLYPAREIKDLDYFCEIAEALVKEKIFFSILKFETKKEIKKELLRKHDFIYKYENKYIILLLNTKKENCKNVLNKLFKENDKYEVKGIYDATEWQEKKEEICK